MNDSIVSTIFDKCKRCYSCIRECPAKAIKVINGQAAVISERCIVCGHCVKVCSQNAKKIADDLFVIFDDLIPNYPVAAVVAPSFAASFPKEYAKLPAALKKIGFSYVVETAFGADLVSELYLKEFESDNKQTIISSSCPAVVNYIEKYRGSLVPNLAKIVSPMIAIGRYLKANSKENLKVVFVGPCVAKKQEYIDPKVEGAIDAVLTFSELKKIIKYQKIDLNELEEIDFDPPHAFMGKSYSLAGGMLKTANISGDILEKEIIVVEGKSKVLEIIDEIANHQINAKFVDILFCEGCISGPAIDSDLNYYSKREKVIKYIEQKVHTIDKQLWKSNIYNSRDLVLTREFSEKNQRKPLPPEEKIKEILAETNKYSSQDELNCGACGYSTCREYAIAIAKDLAEKEMCLPFVIDKLGKAYDDLKDTQEQLQSAEKLASIGQLAAGVAHEINNPLGTIILYASMLKKELEQKLDHKLDYHQNSEDLSLILEEANRCKNIVANLLNFARQGKINVTKIDMGQLLAKIIKTAKINPAYKKIEIISDKLNKECVIEGDEDQIQQVFINLVNNACEAMEESSEKCLSFKMYVEEDYLVTEIKDTGQGIQKENFGKVFTPFFTTKKIGKGTGLGLAIAYGIIKMHNGFINFQSEIGKGTTFRVKLPITINKQLVNSEIKVN